MLVIDFELHFSGCIEDTDCYTKTKFCNSYHICEEKVCPSPTNLLPSAKLKFNHPEQRIGTSAQIICQDGSVYHLGKTKSSEGIPVKQVNLHCMLGSRGEPRYIDDFGHNPSQGCTKGKILQSNNTNV